MLDGICYQPWLQAAPRLYGAVRLFGTHSSAVGLPILPVCVCVCSILLLIIGGKYASRVKYVLSGEIWKCFLRRKIIRKVNAIHSVKDFKLIYLEM